MSCVTSVYGLKSIDLIGQLSRDVIGCLSVKPVMLLACKFGERSKHFLCGDQLINSHTVEAVEAIVSSHLGNLKKWWYM